MDTDFSENTTSERKITERLYVQDRDLRLTQEMLLGSAGFACSRRWAFDPLSAPERGTLARCLRSSACATLLAEGIPLSAAAEKIRPSTVFTTHTPIAAGNEVFETARVEKLLGDYREIMKSPPTISSAWHAPNRIRIPTRST